MNSRHSSLWSPELRGQIGALLGLSFYANYLRVTPILIAPFLAVGFGLDASGITQLSGWTAVGALGAFLLTRTADRYGRRRILLVCMGALPPLCALAALAPDLISYVVVRIPLGALIGSVLALVSVTLSEQVDTEARASAQAAMSIVGRLGEGLTLLVVANLAMLPGTWRWAWALAGLPLFAVFVLRRMLPETTRFEQAAAEGSVVAARFGDLFRDRLRRRATGMLLASSLRSVALAATLSWHYYYAIRTLGISPGICAAMTFVGGSIGLIGNPLGVWLSDHWGRRPTLALFSTLAVTLGAAYYWVPADFELWHKVALLGSCIALTSTAFAIFNIADRCLDTELFPTHLRATYSGCVGIGGALALILCQFTLSVLTRWLGDLGSAIAMLSATTLIPSVVILLVTAPETTGLSLDEASGSELGR